MVKETQPKTIGPRILIDFSRLGIENVPAKVDTGADSSSIWASNIKERNGKLSFVLFGPGSPFYTGAVIEVSDYQIRSIRNSFGYSELRYMVKLKITIENRNLDVNFSLADRSSSRFPVLIGRRTLQRRFLVDVSHGLKKKVEVLVLRAGNLKATNAATKFFKHIETKNKKLRFSFVPFEDLIFYIDEDETKIRVGGKTNRDLKDFDLVYFWVTSSNKDLASATAQYLQQHNVPFFDRAALNYYQSLNKLHQYLVLQDVGVKIPKTMFIPKEKLAGSYKQIVKYLGTEFVLKDIRGKKGRNIFLIQSKQNFLKVCKEAKQAGLDLIAQAFVAHDGHYRMLLLGKQVRLVNYRVHRLSDSRLKDPQLKVDTRLVDQGTIPGSIRQMGIKAASALMIDIAGVDLVKDKQTGTWYCLEVNEAPQLVTGSFLEEKEAAFSDYLNGKLENHF